MKKMIRFPMYTITLLTLSLTLVPSIARSQENNLWEYELAPLYLWALNIDGDLGIRGRTANVGIDFSDVWDNLEGAFTIRFSTLYKRKFGFIVDYTYLDLGTEKVSDQINTDVGITSKILNVAGLYRFIDNQHKLDGAAGVRYTSLDSSISLNNRGIKLSGDQDWVDPIIGLRYSYGLSDTWNIRLYGDIGGFGAASDFTWQALALIDYQPWKYVAIVAGYRALYTDYETGGPTDRFVYDATVHGPVIGIDIRW